MTDKFNGLDQGYANFTSLVNVCSFVRKGLCLCKMQNARMDIGLLARIYGIAEQNLFDLQTRK